MITDRRLSRGRSHDDVVAAALRGGASIIQLRDKDLDRAELIEVGGRLAELCHAAGALFMVNDDPEVARASGADGVHLGPDDPAPAIARAQLGPAAIIGFSAKASVEAARAAGADYVVAGSIFPTSTKSGATVVGLPAISAMRRAVDVTVAAIGGIDASNVASVIEAGADVACVISAAVAAPDVELACRALLAEIERGLHVRALRANIGENPY